jgi:small subunit ribosomal protein S6
VIKYETTVILEPGLDENQVNEAIERVSQWIQELGGAVLEVQRWGKRRLAYEINRKRDGIYTLILHESPGPVVKEIERRMGLNESFMRVLSVLHVPPELTRAQAEAEGVEVVPGEDGADE